MRLIDQYHMMNRGFGNPNKRRRQDLVEQQDDEDSASSNRRYAAAMANRLDETLSPRGLVQQSLNQQSLNQQQQHQQLLQGSFQRNPNLASEALLSAGNYPLLNPNATSLRNLPLPASRATDPFSNPFLSSASQPSLGGYLDPSPFSAQAGLLGQGLWANEAAQAQLQAQAQLHAQAQAQVQAQAQAVALTPTQRGLLMQGSTAFPTASAQQLPNIPINVGAPASLALPPEARFPSTADTQQHPNNRKRSASFAKESPTNTTATAPSNELTGRPPVVLYMPCDDAVISRYQCLARKQMELFEAQEIDVEAGAQGRNRGIVLGQVGIRCRHCSHLYPRRRTKSSTFYPSKLKSIYQTAQNMANTHLTHTCQYIPQEIRDELLKLSQDKKTSAGGGKEYWSDGARILGVYETETYLRFNPHNDYPGTKRAPEGK